MQTTAIRILGDRYELKRQLGEGGMATIHVAHDLLLEREVIVKMLRPELLSDSAQVERFRREGVALASVHSPHVVSLHDIGAGPSELYLVLRWIRGRTLEELVKASGPLPEARALALIDQVLIGLGALHERRMIHRDLTPPNVMVTWDERAVLIDLGVVLDHRQPTLTPALFSPGTPAFMAPEQLRGPDVDARSDLHQAARLLVYLLTGREDVADLGRVPARLRPTLRRALADDPRDRFLSAGELRAALGRADHPADEDTRPTERMPALALADVLEPEVAPPTPRRRPWLRVLSALAVAALAATGAGLAMPRAGVAVAARVADRGAPELACLAAMTPPEPEPEIEIEIAVAPPAAHRRARVVEPEAVPVPRAIARTPALAAAMRLDHVGSVEAAIGAYRSCLAAAAPDEASWIEARIAELTRR